MGNIQSPVLAVAGMRSRRQAERQQVRQGLASFYAVALSAKARKMGEGVMCRSPRHKVGGLERRDANGAKNIKMSRTLNRWAEGHLMSHSPAETALFPENNDPVGLQTI